MGATVRTPWSEEVYPNAEDWDIDRDHDLSLYSAPLTQEGTEVLAVYPAGQWLRVMHTDAPPAPAA